MDLAFVLSRRQNHFFIELVDAIRAELEILGASSSIHFGRFPEESESRIYVLVPPHEWFELSERRDHPTSRQLRRTIFICGEQPGTKWFDDNVSLAPLAGGVLDINRHAIRVFARQGVAGVEHFAIGWTPSWAHIPVDDFGEPDVRSDARDVDVLHLGEASSKRLATLAGAAKPLANCRCRLLLSDAGRPHSKQQANFVVDEFKWDLLRRTKVLLNIHVGDRPYFEWLRVVQAMCNGCAVVSEHSAATGPLRAGDHFLVGRAETLGLISQGLLADESLRERIARDAYRFLRDELPLRRAVERLVDVAEAVNAKGGGDASPIDWPDLEWHEVPDEPETELTRFPSVTEDPDAAWLRAGLKDSRLELLDLKRSLTRLGLEVRSGRPVPRVTVDSRTRAWLGTAPRVSVIVPLYNYETHIRRALESATRGRYQSIEFVVVDDGSTDDSLLAARRFLSENEGVPALLVRHPVNRGLGVARNTGIDFARGEFVFMLDADNAVYRHGIERLVEALDADPEAVAAYGMLAMYSDSGPAGLLSYQPWRPRRLRAGNYIDAMALWRLSALKALGGFAADQRLHGWEDYDLWCRTAEAGHGVAFVPEIVAEYRFTRHSMLSVTNLSVQTAISVMMERSPRLFAGLEPPL